MVVNILFQMSYASVLKDIINITSTPSKAEKSSKRGSRKVDDHI